MNFAHLTGDHNPVDVDAAVDRRSSFGNVIAHGMNMALSAIEQYLAARLRGGRTVAWHRANPAAVPEAGFCR
jgi:acyl dehydratase